MEIAVCLKEVNSSLQNHVNVNLHLIIQGQSDSHNIYFQFY